MRRTIVAILTVSLFSGGLFAAAPPAGASPVAFSEEEYLVYNRIFPDPHGCQARTAPYSPFAKGQVCAADFLQFAELEGGLAIHNGHAIKKADATIKSDCYGPARFVETPCHN